MSRAGSLTVFVAWLTMAASAEAQTPAWRLHWQPGQVLNYRVEHTMTATEVVQGTTAETVNKMNEVKRWQVLGVAPDGVATLQLMVTALRFETKTHKGDVLLFDSAHPDQSTPDLREQMAKYVNQPLAEVRVDATGRVLGVKDLRQSANPVEAAARQAEVTARFECEPPFDFVLPPTVPQPGQTWERNYNVTLEPPQGTGEKLPAIQKYTCKSVDAKGALVAVTTVLPKMPEAVADRVPLMQMMPEGEVVFDPQAGLLRSARLSIDKQLAGHQGDGSTYHFKSSYVEEFAGN